MQQCRVKVYLPGSKQRIRRFALDIENDFQNQMTFEKFSKWLYNTCKIENACNYKMKYMDSDKEWVTLMGTDSEWRECMNVLGEQKTPVLKLKISKNHSDEKQSKETAPVKAKDQKESKKASIHCLSTSVEDLQQTIATILQRNAGEKTDVITHDFSALVFPEPVQGEDRVCAQVKQMLQEILDRRTEEVVEEQDVEPQQDELQEEIAPEEEERIVVEEDAQEVVPEVEKPEEEVPKQQPFFILPETQAPHLDASPYAMHLKILADMGIGTPQTVLPLLIKHKGNMERVVDEYYRSNI